MSKVRLRRLKADYDRICTMFAGKSRIKVLDTVGTPPEKYQVEFLVTSLQKDHAAQALHTHNNFIAEIVLTGAYPRMAPQCKMLTPVFHPNIAPHAICIGDHWAAGESLPALIVRIAEMLAFQSYNVKSPLNGEAAQWVEQNKDKLPMDVFDFGALLDRAQAAGVDAEGHVLGSGCANCGKPAGSEEMFVCMNRHITCRDCMMQCPMCKGILCLKCTVPTCSICGTSVCHKCIYKCPACTRFVCHAHAGACHICGSWKCTDCLVTCARCGRSACIDHVTRVYEEWKEEFVCTQCAEAMTSSSAAQTAAAPPAETAPPPPPETPSPVAAETALPGAVQARQSEPPPAATETTLPRPIQVDDRPVIETVPTPPDPTAGNGPPAEQSS